MHTVHTFFQSTACSFSIWYVLVDKNNYLRKMIQRPISKVQSSLESFGVFSRKRRCGQTSCIYYIQLCRRLWKLNIFRLIFFAPESTLYSLNWPLELWPSVRHMFFELWCSRGLDTSLNLVCSIFLHINLFE